MPYFLLRAIVVVLLLGLPLLGAVVAGLPLAPYLEFPPTTQPTVHPDFSWTVFGVIAFIALATMAPFPWRVIRARATCPASLPPVRYFPWWGRAALIWIGIMWAVAWNLWPSLTEIRRNSFTPLWLGYIVLVNALRWRRAGNSLLTHYPRYLGKLFILSAAFWWFFEYLNRFVNNWYYQGIENYTSWEYFLSETIQFSTVMPAIISTYTLLQTYPRLWWGLQQNPPLYFSQPRLWSGAALLTGATGLLGLAIFPRQLYPLVWIAPLVVVTATQITAGYPSVLFPLAHGDWRLPWLGAVAGIICGLFWEMWNWGSGYPHWIYSIPWVQRFHLFEMPLLGYSGYLPFGIECLAVAHLYLTSKWFQFPYDHSTGT